MTFDERVLAVTKFGFMERQARFLVTVMLHSGVCVPRQYARFAGTAYGHNVAKFFAKLSERGYATASDCLHNRAALYHLHHQALYRAIGQPQSRYRRPVSARQAVDRVRLLDGVISNPELVWLATEEDKVAFFNLMAPLHPPERLPHIITGKPVSGRLHLFPDGLPVGVGSNGRVVFLFLVTSPFDADLRRFLQQHAELLHALPGWTLQLLFLRRSAGMMSAFENAAREELTGRFAPGTVAELTWYCAERRSTSDLRARCQSDARFWQAHRAFAAPRCQTLYRRRRDRWRHGVRAGLVDRVGRRLRARDRTHRIACLARLVRSSLPSGEPRPFVAKGGRGGGHSPDTASTPSISAALDLRTVDPRLVSPRCRAQMLLRRKELQRVSCHRWGGVFCCP